MSDKSTQDGKKLGLFALIAIVVSSMIGSGVDGLPQNMAANSALAPVLIAWLICGFGMFFIAKTFMILSNIRPDLSSGIYMYAREGFGPLTAFISGWGYWFMTMFSNVAFAIMVMDVLNYFLPGDFIGGNNIPSLIGASLLIWGFNFLVLSGTKVAGSINLIGTLAKMIPLIMFVFIVLYYLNWMQFTSNVWGHSSPDTSQNLGPILKQVIDPLDVALWCFIGVESAVALSDRAKNKKDISKATFIGFMISLSICVLVSILPFGVLSQTVLSQIATPSTAGVLKIITGTWGELLINIGVLISILASWLAWTMICAEIPMVAAKDGTFPQAFAKKNKNEAASISLWVSSLIMQAIIILVYFSKNAWLTMLAISAITVLPAYFSSAAYLFKISSQKTSAQQYFVKGRFFAVISSVISIIFCCFMLYASDIRYVVLTPLLLTLGLPFFIWAKKHTSSVSIFHGYEKVGVAVLLLCNVIAIMLYATGTLVF
ncbi:MULTISPECIES: basic amino acid/polyamine antiporter [unclassified Acinetobacter]|uniref:basic amino acid/polyamine antiporter n=1 Tax=unclassified Acinetobacter TaxID=196816 RepID=UPI0029350FB6|nr:MULTISPECIES: basic amino acid/polyamine antiporter [unclassified Acinetobacter]WOE30570.1 basic amino acid/polyamine antiporter [Acinetobacter sp. SAAs470]WOE38762.1 basic amino acid/polyamine antiporter [Acinetobacter sp. SAAs474]